MKRRAFTLIEALVVVAILGILAAILLPVFMNGREANRSRGCQYNLKQIGLSFRQYTQDYDTKFPPTKMSGSAYGWAYGLWGYMDSTELFQCPSEAHPRGKEGKANGYTNYCDYWFNRRLAGVAEKQVKNPSITILSGDGNIGLDVTDVRYSKYRLPPRWIQDKNSPAYRHFDGANYGFADGHVKWLKPTQVTSFPVARQMPTFAVR